MTTTPCVDTVDPVERDTAEAERLLKESTQHLEAGDTEAAQRSFDKASALLDACSQAMDAARRADQARTRHDLGEVGRLLKSARRRIAACHDHIPAATSELDQAGTSQDPGEAGRLLESARRRIAACDDHISLATSQLDQAAEQLADIEESLEIDDLAAADSELVD